MLDKVIEHLEAAQQILVAQAQADKSKSKWERLMDVGNRLRICKDMIKEII